MHPLPENSERYIQYHSGRYVICWVKRITWNLYRAIVRRDAHRAYKGMVGMYDQANRTAAEKTYRTAESAKSERVAEAWDHFKFHQRRNPNAEDGTGVSIKGMRSAEAST